MFGFVGEKWTFLVSLGINCIVFSVIYFKGFLNFKLSYGPMVLPYVLSCPPNPEKCKDLLPHNSYKRWERTQCQELIFNNPLNCYRLQTEVHFIMKPLSKEEEDFPLAFIIAIHKDLEMFVRLLRAIYAPQNIYCIHIDAKAPDDYRVSVERLVECFPNVFIASICETVTYAGFSRLKADINCMKDLVRSPVKWQRVINLCGQDFPVMSNLELVRYMKDTKWRDNNMTPGIKQPDYIQYRTQTRHKEIPGRYVVSTGYKKTPPPHSLEIYFGTAYYSLKRAFVEYVLTSSVAKDLLEWSKDTYSPDEHYWVTLNHVKGAPGSNTHTGWDGNIRAIKWRDQENTVHQGCKGIYLRDVCIYSVEDLPWIIESNWMFANKFDSAIFPEALKCMEQWHRNKVLQQAMVPIQSSWQLAIEINNSSAILAG